MIMMLDTMAERYGMLPSEVMERASTFDLFVCDTAIGYRNYQQEKAMGVEKTYDPQDYSQDELLKILKETRQG